MDEIFTWKEVSDRSLWHLYYAIQHGADGGQPLFYTTAWLWARTFGFGALALRLYSSVAMCGALLVTWRTVRRFYGIWATAFGVLFFWGTSGVLLEQNVEARVLRTLHVVRSGYDRHLYASGGSAGANTPASGARLFLTGGIGVDPRFGYSLRGFDPFGINPFRCGQG